MMASVEAGPPDGISAARDPEEGGGADGMRAPSREAAAAAQTARDLLDRPLPPGYREEWARHFARSDRGVAAQDTTSEDSKTVMIFRLGEEWLALPTGILHDVVEPKPIRSLPHRRDAIVLGLVNIRGELLLCVSLHALLHIEQDKSTPHAARADSLRRLVVMGRKDRRLAFVADEMHGVRRYDRSAALAVPATISLAASAFTTSMLNWEGRSVGCLDETLVLDMLDRSLA
jgi:chemotaxis-related protein WspD